MDSGLSIRPARSVARTGGTRRPGAVRATIVTDLATSETVTAAPDAVAVHNDTMRAAPAAPSDSAQVILDAHSREVIYRAVDMQSSRVALPTAEVVAKRLQAYARSAAETAHPKDPQANFEI